MTYSSIKWCRFYQIIHHILLLFSWCIYILEQALPVSTGGWKKASVWLSFEERSKLFLVVRLYECSHYLIIYISYLINVSRHHQWVTYRDQGQIVFFSGTSTCHSISTGLYRKILFSRWTVYRNNPKMKVPSDTGYFLLNHILPLVCKKLCMLDLLERWCCGNV